MSRYDDPKNPLSMSPAEPSGLPTGDPRVGCAEAIQTGRLVVDGIDPSQLDRPTPCADYTVRDLLNHLAVAVRRLDLAGRGFQGDWGPVLATDVADGGHSRALAEAGHAVATTWSDDSLLGRTLRLPFADLPGAMAVGLYTAEFLTHAWDLAVATDQTIEWPEAVTEASVIGMTMGLPAEGRGDDIPFDPPVAVDTDAPAIERLVAWSGRNPADWPSAA